MDVKKNTIPIGGDIFVSIKFVKGIRKFRNRKGIREVMGWSKFFNEQAKMYKCAFPNELYIINGIPRKK